MGNKFKVGDVCVFDEDFAVKILGVVLSGGVWMYEVAPNCSKMVAILPPGYPDFPVEESRLDDVANWELDEMYECEDEEEDDSGWADEEDPEYYRAMLRDPKERGLGL